MVKMEAYNDGEMWCARGIGVGIFTQGQTFDELLENIKNSFPTNWFLLLEKKH